MATGYIVSATDMKSVADAIRTAGGTTAGLSFPTGFVSATQAINTPNFKIVGGTSQPSSPSTNTIWVNTSTSITLWKFSSAQPDSPAEGWVWIQTGTLSDNAFNALKQNSLIVYPVAVKQYVSGAWVEKIAKIYTGSAWVELLKYYYRAGSGSTIGSWTPFVRSSNQTIAFGTSYIQVKLGHPDFSEWNIQSPAVDLTNITTLYFDLMPSDKAFTCGVSKTKYTSWTDSVSFAASVNTGATATRQTKSLDVSGLTGTHYITFKSTHNDAGSVYYIYNVWAT